MNGYARPIYQRWQSFSASSTKANGITLEIERMAKKKLKQAPLLTEEQLIQELITLENIQQRIDRVAEDFESGENRYDGIDAWKLGELLGLDFHDTGDWCRSYYGLKEDLDNLGDSHPYADHIELIKNQLTPARYKKLSKLVEEIREDEDKPDLPLTKKEIRLLKETYAESQIPDCSYLILATTTVTSSDGVELEFEVCIGDGGEPYDAVTPYDLDCGLGFDSSDYIQIE